MIRTTEQHPAETLPERRRNVTRSEGRAAARAQVKTDRRGGIEAPQWITDPAEAEIPWPTAG